MSIHRRLRLDPESFSNLRRKRVRSQTPAPPFAFPRTSVVEVPENDNGPLGPSFVQGMNALEEEQDYERAGREERPERNCLLTGFRAPREQ